MMRLALFVPCFLLLVWAVHSKGFECLLDEKDEGMDWSCQGG